MFPFYIAVVQQDQTQLVYTTSNDSNDGSADWISVTETVEMSPRLLETFS